MKKVAEDPKFKKKVTQLLTVKRLTFYLLIKRRQTIFIVDATIEALLFTELSLDLILGWQFL